MDLGAGFLLHFLFKLIHLEFSCPKSDRQTYLTFFCIFFCAVRKKNSSNNRWPHGGTDNLLGRDSALCIGCERVGKKGIWVERGAGEGGGEGIN